MLALWRNRAKAIEWALAALVETAGAIPWLIFLYSIQDEKRWAEAIPGAWLLLVAFGIAALWEFGKEGQRFGTFRRMSGMVAGVVGLYLVAYAILPAAMKPEHAWQFNLAMGSLPVIGSLWYQGARLRAEGLEYATVFSRFTRQAVIFVVALILLLVSGGGRNPQVQVMLFWAILQLFVAGMLLVVVTRQRYLRQGQAKLGLQGTGGGRGSRTMPALVAGLTLLTLLAARVASVDRLTAVLRLVWQVLDRPFTWVADVGMLLLYRWMLLIAVPAGAVMRWILAHRVKPPEKPPEQMTMGVQPDKLPQNQLHTVESMVPYLKWALVVAGFLMLAVLLYRLNRRRAGRVDLEEEERVSLGFWANFMADLRALFQHGQSGAVGGTAPSLAGAPEPDPRSPRALFRRLQRWGWAVGRPRSVRETPGAYSVQLAAVRPEAGSAAAAITAVYNQARYSPVEPDGADVERAASLLAELEARSGSSQ